VYGGCCGGSITLMLIACDFWTSEMHVVTGGLL
jgi:hypothetical protein